MRTLFCTTHNTNMVRTHIIFNHTVIWHHDTSKCPTCVAGPRLEPQPVHKHRWRLVLHRAGEHGRHLARVEDLGCARAVRHAHAHVCVYMLVCVCVRGACVGTAQRAQGVGHRGCGFGEEARVLRVPRTHRNTHTHLPEAHMHTHVRVRSTRPRTPTTHLAVPRGVGRVEGLGVGHLEAQVGRWVAPVARGQRQAQGLRTGGGEEGQW